MPLAGRHLSIEEALALCHRSGWRRKQLRWAVAIMTAESGRYVEAWGQNINAAGTVLSTDRGLFQINDKAHPELSDAAAYKAVPNAAYARGLYERNGWTPWAVYNKGTFRKFLPLIYPVWAVLAWKRLVSTISQELA